MQESQSIERSSAPRKPLPTGEPTDYEEARVVVTRELRLHPEGVFYSGPA